MNYGKLSPAGASRLRQVRAFILEHPQQYDWDQWDCGTTACIGGHLCRLAQVTEGCSDHALSLLGFSPDNLDAQHLGYRLFFSHESRRRARNAEDAAAFINDFLWDFGYPPDEITDEPMVKCSKTLRGNLENGPYSQGATDCSTEKWKI